MTDALMGDRVKKGAEVGGGAREWQELGRGGGGGAEDAEGGSEGRAAQEARARAAADDPSITCPTCASSTWTCSRILTRSCELDDDARPAAVRQGDRRLAGGAARRDAQNRQQADQRDGCDDGARALPAAPARRPHRARADRARAACCSRATSRSTRSSTGTSAFRAQHGWLRREHMAGRRLPSTPDDMQVAMQLKPTRDSYQLMQRARRRLKPEPRPRSGRRRPAAPRVHPRRAARAQGAARPRAASRRSSTAASTPWRPAGAAWSARSRWRAMDVEESDPEVLALEKSVYLLASIEALHGCCCCVCVLLRLLRCGGCCWRRRLAAGTCAGTCAGGAAALLRLRRRDRLRRRRAGDRGGGGGGASRRRRSSRGRSAGSHASWRAR